MATYYVAASGGNNGNPGTEAQPWATIAYGVANAGSGNTVYLLAGTHSVSSAIAVPTGVSITGAGETSIISSTAAGADEFAGTLSLQSNTEGTNGNQSISYIKLDGNNYTANCGIIVSARSNVKIHHCWIRDFNYWGVIFNGIVGGWASDQPSTYATGNEIYDCDIYDCADYNTDWGRGCLGVGGQQGLKCYNNTIEQPARGAAWSHGWCWKFFSDGYNKGLKIYNNHLIKAPFMGEYNDWDFAMEFCMHEQGGIEIYNNRIEGEINLGARRKGDYDYSFYIHHNDIGKAVRNNQREIGIGTENVINDLYIRYNYFHNLAFGMYTHGGDVGDHSNNVFVQYNIFDQIGNAGEACGWEGYVGNGNGDHHNWYIENNVYTQYSGYTGGNGKGFMFMPTEQMSYIYFRNNIYVGWDYTPVLGYNGGGGTLDHFYFENNLIYDCGSSNSFYWESGYNPTNVTNQNNIRGDNPDFVGGSPYSYKLQAGSPAIDAGLDLGLTQDYDGNVVPYNSVPDIGVYEYGSSPATTTTTTLAPNIALDSHNGNNLDVYNAVGGFVGKIGTCYYFSTHDYLGDLTARVSSLELTSAISISAWFKTNVSDSAYHTIVSNYSADYGYALSMNSSYQIEWLVGNGTTTGVKTTSSTYNDNAWHHVVATFDGTNVLLYMDGALVGGVPVTWNNNIAYNADCRYIVGARNNANTGERYWEGYLDEIAVYNRELQLGDVEDLYNSGSGVTYPFY